MPKRADPLTDAVATVETTSARRKKTGRGIGRRRVSATAAPETPAADVQQAAERTRLDDGCAERAQEEQHEGCEREEDTGSGWRDHRRRADGSRVRREGEVGWAGWELLRRRKVRRGCQRRLLALDGHARLPLTEWWDGKSVSRDGSWLEGREGKGWVTGGGQGAT